MESLFEGELNFENHNFYKKWSKFFWLKVDETHIISTDPDKEEIFVNWIMGYHNELYNTYGDETPYYVMKYGLEDWFFENDLLGYSEKSNYSIDEIEGNKLFYIFGIIMREQYLAEGNKLSIDSELFILDCAEYLGIGNNEFIEDLIKFANDELKIE